MKSSLTACIWAGALTIAAPAFAQDVDALFQEVSRTTQEQLLITYICKDDLGSSWYQAARTMAEGTMQQFGMTPDEAVLQAQEYEDRIKSMLAAQGNPVSQMSGMDKTNFCLDGVNSANNAARVAAARAREALAQ